MKAFKVRRNDQDYFRVELPMNLFPDGKRRSVMAKTRREALDKAHELLELRKKGLKNGRGQGLACRLPSTISLVLQNRGRRCASDVAGLSVPH